MPSKMLSYPSLKSVLQYMEANLRFNLSQHLPGIRTAEKTVPLQIVDCYSHDKSILTINNVAYHLYSSKNRDCRSPGYVPFKGEAEFERKLREGTKTLPSNEFSIKLTTTVVASKKLQTETVAYSKNLSEAYKYRITKLLGRGHSVRVKNLDISMQGCFSWPLGLKLVVQNLKAWKIEDMEHLQEILCDTSFPLQHLEIEVCSAKWPETTRKVMEKTDRLVLDFAPNYEFLRHRIRNRRFRASGHQLVALDYMNIVRDWRAEKRKIGSCWEFGGFDGPEIRQFFESLKCQVGVISVGEKNVQIPTDGDTTIEVEYNEKQKCLSIKVVSNETL